MPSKWNYLPFTSIQSTIADTIAAQCNIKPVISQLLVQRGIETPAQADAFFNPSLDNLHDPFLMQDMDKAVNRLNEALGRKERIMVYGDYDVDGTTAVALVYRYLLNYYSNIEYYIPTRYEEGYGVSMKSIDTAAQAGVKLIIILDCGIKAIDEIAYAKQKGIDFIICDHHVPDDQLPPAAAILNPKLADNPYPFKHLSGCGVGYKLMHAFALSNGLDINELRNMLDLVAVSIAADIVPLIGENRIMAHFGIKRLNSCPNLGLKSIIRICGLASKELTINDVIFKIGPRINASGRMQSGMEAVALLVTKDPADAHEKAKEIDQYNKDRKELDKRITEEANSILEQRGDATSGKKPIVIYNKDWHKGIIGIVASRMTEIYCRPAVVLTYSNGIVTGSSRSVHGFDIYKAIDSTRDLLENFGGHTYAVGLSLKEENIPEFTRRFEQYVIDNISPEQISQQITVDCDISFSDITPEFLAQLRMFNPFGPANAKPIFHTSGVYDYGTSKLVGKQLEHIRLELVDSTCNHIFNGIAFNQARYFEYIKERKPVDICYTIEENKRLPAGNLQLQIKDIDIESEE